jgi:hypothetical protein
MTFGFLFAAAIVASAQETKPADATGTWKWSMTTPNGETRETSLTIKKDGEKLAGTITGRNGDTPVENLKVDKDQISFDVVRERDGNKFVTKYNGKISGDAIKGKSEFTRGDQTREREWEAKREGAKTASKDISGTYNYTLKISDDFSLEPVLTLKQEGDKITGSIKVNDNESPISDATFKDNEISFKTTRERDGQKFVSNYKGKIDGDSIKGKVESKWGDTDRSFDWNAKKAK